MESDEKDIPVNSDVLKIYNPNDFPFGPLSNNYLFDMNIDGKRWSTVTNYILSNMINTPLYKLSLQQAQIKESVKKTNIEDKIAQVISNTEVRQGYKLNASDIERVRQMVLKDVALQKMNIHELYNFYLGEEYIHTIRTAVENAYNVKISTDEQLQATLLETENRPIVYVSGNNVLGAGQDGNGQNLIGRILMQIRHNLRMLSSEKTKKLDQKTMDDSIFHAYQAMHILRKKLEEGNDLREYMGKRAADIVEEEKVDIITDQNLKETIIQMYHRGQFPIIAKELESPGYMVLAARRDNLKELQKRIEIRKQVVILEKYTEYMIRKKFPKMRDRYIKKAVSQLIDSAPSIQDYITLRTKIVQKYLEGKLDEDLNVQIQAELADLPEISDEDLVKAGKMIIEYFEPKPSLIEESSMSSDDDNPLKQLLAESGEKERRKVYISQLQQYTGHSSRKYKRWTIEQLQEELQKYHGEEPEKAPQEEAGEWVIRIRHRNNKLEILKKVKGGLRPGKEVVEKLIKKYNKTNPGRQILPGQVNITWISNIKNTVKFKNQIEDVDQSFVKYIGDPVEIRPMINQNPDELKEFSPIFEKKFKVADLVYPSVSFYITTMLITQTGISRDVKDKRIYKRTTTVEHSRQLLMKPNGDFMSPDEANQVYNKRNIESHRELMETYARIAMKTKFENILLGRRLLLTGNRELVWNDPNDTLLGTGTRKTPGENVGGKILMDIRNSIIENPKPYNLDLKLTESPMRIFKEPFLNSWMKMRLEDMCTVVYKMKQYLSIVGNQEEDIDGNFVRHVLNSIYPSCIPNEDDSNPIPVPEDFVRMIKDCKGLSKKLSKDYNKELRDIQKEMNDYDNVFWDRKEQKNVKKQETDEYKKILTFDENQRKEWQDFLIENNKPKLPWADIYQRIAKQKRLHEKDLQKIVDKKKRKEVESEQKNELQNLWSELTSLDERNRRMDAFRLKQDAQMAEYYGWKTQVKSKEQLAQRQEVIKNFKERIAQINRNKKDEEKHIQFNITDVAQAYWDRIVYMFRVISSIPGQTSFNAEKLIINAEHLTSQEAICNNIQNLDDEQDNCIASALSNILIAIETFKYQYQEDIPFGINDIDLAMDIILTRDLKEPKSEDEDFKEERELIDEEAEDDMIGGEDEDHQSYDYGDDEEFGFARFGMEKPDDRTEIIRMILSEIPKKRKDLPIKDSMVNHFNNAIAIVKNSKLPDVIKTNRINFFATLRN